MPSKRQASFCFRVAFRLMMRLSTYEEQTRKRPEHVGLDDGFIERTVWFGDRSGCAASKSKLSSGTTASSRLRLRRRARADNRGMMNKVWQISRRTGNCLPFWKTPEMAVTEAASCLMPTGGDLPKDIVARAPHKVCSLGL